MGRMISDNAARTILSRAKTPAERRKATREALRLGVPLHEIEAFLDWLDQQPPKDPPRAKRA